MKPPVADCTMPLKWAAPATSSRAAGAVVPIPTLPAGSTYILIGLELVLFEFRSTRLNAAGVVVFGPQATIRAELPPAQAAQKSNDVELGVTKDVVPSAFTAPLTCSISVVEEVGVPIPTLPTVC